MLHLSNFSEAENQHFFELAATIIPVILFGSVLAKAFRPPDEKTKITPWHGVAAILLAVYITVMATTEVLAISAAIGRGWSEAARIVVAAALVVEMFGFGFAILLPWAVRFGRSRKPHWLAGTVLGMIFLAFVGWISVYFIGLALEGSRGEELTRELGQAEEATQMTQLAWYRGVIAAKVDHQISPLEKKELTLLWQQKEEATRQDFLLRQPTP